MGPLARLSLPASLSAAALAWALGARPAEASPPPEFIELVRLEPRWRFDLVYARPDNFAGQVIYPRAVCALRRSVAEPLPRAQAWLDAHAPGLILLFKDCYRPDSAQRKLYAAVRGTPKSAYLANPASGRGSMHSYGAAVDVTLADERTGLELDLGTPHDFLGVLAEPRHEKRLLAEGKLTKTQVERRQTLRSALRAAGWRSIPNEWWHFDAGTHDEIVSRFERLDVPLEAIGGTQK